MNKTRQFTSVAILTGTVIGFGVATGSARADTVNLKYTGHIGDTAHIHYASQTGHVYDGLYKFDVTDRTGVTGALVPNYAFCIDLYQDAPEHQSETYNIADLANGSTLGDNAAGKADYITELWDQHFNNNWYTAPGDAIHKTDASAFSLAVWELVNEDYQTNASNYDVTSSDPSGGFYVTDDSNAATLANDWLGQLTANYTITDGLHLVALTNGSYQDFVSAYQSSPAHTVPLPASGAEAMLLLVGLEVLGIRRHWRGRMA